MVDFYLNTNEAILSTYRLLSEKQNLTIGLAHLHQREKEKGGLPAQQKNYMEYLLEERD